MQRVRQAFGAFGLFAGELHDDIVRMQTGFSRGRIVIHGGNRDPFIRRAAEVSAVAAWSGFQNPHQGMRHGDENCSCRPSDP